MVSNLPTTAAGRSRSANDHIVNELLQYASDLSTFNDANGVDGAASFVPRTIELAARNIQQVSTHQKYGLYTGMKWQLTLVLCLHFRYTIQLQVIIICLITRYVIA